MSKVAVLATLAALHCGCSVTFMQPIEEKTPSTEKARAERVSKCTFNEASNNRFFDGLAILPLAYTLAAGVAMSSDKHDSISGSGTLLTLLSAGAIVGYGRSWWIGSSWLDRCEKWGPRQQAQRQRNACQQLEACTVHGRCAFVDGNCIANEDSDCIRSKDCARLGKCTAKRGVCVSAK